MHQFKQFSFDFEPLNKIKIIHFFLNFCSYFLISNLVLYTYLYSKVAAIDSGTLGLVTLTAITNY